MSILDAGGSGERVLFMGNDAIARGALEAGVRVVSGYPGTPSSEIVQNLADVARQRHLYVEWSINEKVALEVAAAASFSQLRSLCVMKQVGVNVASDFLLHLSLYGTRGGMVLVTCEDPGALSSTNEGESRPYAKWMECPLLEPGDFQEAKDMTRWAFDLSEELHNVVMVRSVTRLSHASGNVVLGPLPESGDDAGACFRFEGPMLGQVEGPVTTLPGTVDFMHRRQQDKLKQAAERFETSPFNTYHGPASPELLIITSSACALYAKEALDLLGMTERVGLLKLGTTWPLPPRLLEGHLRGCPRALVVEEVLPFLEDNLKALATQLAPRIGSVQIHGKGDGSLPSTNEMNPDRVITALCSLLGCEYRSADSDYAARAATIRSEIPARALAFCPGCPHRATFWSLSEALALDGRKGFVCGDIGCYTLAAFETGYHCLHTAHAMGSGLGLASGFGKLDSLGLNQPVLAVCGDSTFFHAAMPALVNAIHNRSNLLLAVLDNRGTAMTGFQPHPGLPLDAAGDEAVAIDIPALCRALGARVVCCDPFELERSRSTLLELMEGDPGVKVVVFQQACALSPERKGKKRYLVEVDEAACVGEACGCNRLCTRVFKCPGLVWDSERGVARIDEVICAGCGVCVDICPAGAIVSALNS